MIQAAELRIGNWITKDSNGKPYQVSGVTDVDIRFVNSHAAFVNLTSPIPITPEILISCGFKKERGKSDYDWIYNKNEKLTLADISVAKDGNDIHIFLWSGDCLRHINSVHQLQNLWFAIAGKELEIKL